MTPPAAQAPSAGYPASADPSPAPRTRKLTTMRSKNITPTRRFLSLGAGRQSTALFIMGCEGEVLPKLDAAIFADTQWEPRHVMAHLGRLQQFGAEHGVPVYLASKGSLPLDVLDRQVFATLPAWTRIKPYEMVPVEMGECQVCHGVTPDDSDALFGDSGCEDCHGGGVVPVRWEKRLRNGPTDGRIKRQCTPKYKIEPINQQVRLLLGADETHVPCRYCLGTGMRVAPWDPEAGAGDCSICRGSGFQRRVGAPAAGQHAEQWIGFSTDEIERVSDAGFPGYQTPRFPLLELGWTVEHCNKFTGDRGWQSEKSACKGCPLHDDDIWIDMKANDPEEFAEVVEYDRAFRNAPGLNADRYLHESRKPLDVAVAEEEARRALSKSQLVFVEIGAPRRKPARGCSPYGCRTSEYVLEEAS